jgi:hypothetical protein
MKKKGTEANILKEYFEMNMRIWDNIKMNIKNISFIFRQFFTTTLGKDGFFEKLVRLFFIKTINIFKNFALEIF